MYSKKDLIKELWSTYRGGDTDALGEIFVEQFHDLYYYGLKLVYLPEVVKDVIQDIFTDLWLKKETVVDIKNIQAYLFVALRHELLRAVKKIRNFESSDSLPGEMFVFSGEDFMIQEEVDLEVKKQLVECLHKLTERQREVILHRFKHEMEFEEIGQIMDMNVQSVRNLLFRALEKMRKEVSMQDDKAAGDVDLILFVLFR